MYIYTHVFAYICIYIYLHICIHIWYIYVCMCVYMYVYIYVYIFMYIHIYTYELEEPHSIVPAIFIDLFNLISNLFSSSLQASFQPSSLSFLKIKWDMPEEMSPHDRAAVLYVPWLIYMRAMTSSCMFLCVSPHDRAAVIYVPWLVYMCAMTHPCVCHDSFICVHVCDSPWSRCCDICAMTCLYVCHDSSMCLSWFIHTCACVRFPMTALL